MQPELGIFFLFDGKLHIESTPLADAEPYGDRHGHPGGHEAMWDRLIASGKVPGDEEYQNVPRGRVVYTVPTSTFTLYADPCILRDRKIVLKIVDFLRLPQERTTKQTDEHYRCPHCGG